VVGGIVAAVAVVGEPVGVALVLAGAAGLVEVLETDAAAEGAEVGPLPGVHAPRENTAHIATPSTDTLAPMPPSSSGPRWPAAEMGFPCPPSAPLHGPVGGGLQPSARWVRFVSSEHRTPTHPLDSP
jgi:hypothetical protein